MRINVKRLLPIFYTLVFSASTVLAQGTCTASISAIPRNDGAWTDGTGTSFQIYDIRIVNSGSCVITSLVGFFGFPSTGQISSSWNYDASTGAISNFGDSLQPGQIFSSAGFILSGGVTPTLALNIPSCPASCAGTTGTSSGSTGTPSSTGTTSGGSTTGSTPSSCNASVAIGARPGASFLLSGAPVQIYDLDIKNTGTLSISSIVITISPLAGTQVVQNNKWNLDLTATNQYTVDLFGALTLSQAHYSGAGFVLSGTNATTATPSVTVFSVSC